MKKLTAWILMVTMFTTLVPASIFANTRLPIPVLQTDEEINTGKLEVVLSLDYPVVYENIENSAITITLLKDLQNIVTVKLKKSTSWTDEYYVNTDKYLVSIFACDKNGIELGKDAGEIKYVYSYKMTFDKIPTGNYQIKFTGNNYKEYISEILDISSYSKHVIVGTNNATFTVGDVNKDNSINNIDLEKSKELIAIQANKTGSIQNGDINQDGIIDITDLTYIYSNIGATGEAIISSTNLIFKNDIIKTDGLLTNNDKLSALSKEDINILFGKTESDNPVVLKRPDNAIISETTPIELPIEFNNPVQMEQIKITPFSMENAPKKGTAIVTYINENGTEQIENFDFNSNITEEVRLLPITGERVVIKINLGKKVAVKKIIIRITETTTANAKLSDIAKVEFLQDIVPENPQPSIGIIKGLKAVGINEAVELSWNKTSNTTAYKVYYGTETGNYSDSLTTEQNYIKINNLENMKTYYFAVMATNGDWVGPLSNEVTATPKSPTIPNPPKGIEITPDNEMLIIYWSASENTTHYNLYYKKSGDTEYTKSPDDIKTTNYTIGNLINNVEYSVYLTASNELGESTKSEILIGIPKNSIIHTPKVPTQNLIDNSHIIDVKLADKNNVNMDFYPSGYNPRNVVDGDYSTHWTSRIWWEDPSHIITFDNSYDMNYIAYSPRLNGIYKNSLGSYSITVWGPDDDLNGNGTQYYYKKPISGYNKDTGFAILTFPKTNVKQIKVGVHIWNGAPTQSTASEILFYEYYSVDDEIKALFANKLCTTISPTATKAEIERLRTIINGQEGHYFVDKTILLEELDMAEALLNNDTSKLGKILNVETGRNASENHGFDMSLNDFQPIGISAAANNKIVVYVDSPTNEVPTLIATQYYPNWNNWKKEIILEQGRNVIEIPQIGSESKPGRGGSLYLTYKGQSKDVRIHVKGGTQIPVLTVDEYVYDNNSATIKADIKTYINELSSYVASLNGNKQDLYTNVTEIAMKDVLLSIPASQVLNAITSSGNIDAQIESLYNSLKAWEKEIEIQYKVHGLSHDIKEGVNSWPSARINIRYTRMFEGAFMYASSGHIGIEWGSTSGMVGTNFGWGISHEIGHVIDQSGLSYAEVTNNIYSLFSQTYDNGSTMGTSRLEASNKYKDIYNKVSRSTPGKANDVFVQLGMYWQLHLAYDDAGADSYYDFYSKLYQDHRAGGYDGLDKDNLFVVLASKATNKNLTEFFERWGIKVSTLAKTYIDNLPKETRAIYYINDDARRYRLNGGQGINNNIPITANVSVDKNIVTINIKDDANSSDVLGYEIYRNNEAIGFTTEPKYTDIIGTANNRSFSYKIKAYDKLLNVPREIEATPQIKVGYDVTVETKSIKHSTNILDIDLGSEQQIAGIKFIVPNIVDDSVYGTVYDSVYENNKFIVEISLDGQTWTKVKSDTFSANSEGVHKSYFNKISADEEDTYIGIYDARYLRIIGNDSEMLAIKDSVEVLLYPGDNIEITTTAIGYLKEDYTYDTMEGTETIKSGTLIVTGSYRGDPLYNVIVLKGMYSENGQFEDSDKQIEKPINGYSLLFADIPSNGNVSEIDDGFWLFVPDVQEEPKTESLPEEGHKVSVLPNQIKAELYRSMDPTDLTNAFLVSDTVWITSPSEVTMPYIILD